MKRETHRQSSKGFSLVELLAVVAIIAIMAAVGLPALAGYFRLARVRSAAGQVASEIQRARSKAIQGNANFGTVFVVVSDTQYQMFSEDVINQGTGLPIMSRQGFLAAAANNQAGTLLNLPRQVQFVTQAGGAAAGPFVRFNRLGAACNPSGSPVCSPLAAVVDAPLGAAGNYFKARGTARVVTVRDLDTGIDLDISISQGGRVAAERTNEQRD
jgi:prepilin-type N-terminal cleavage/methylation domain-containing protein